MKMEEEEQGVTIGEILRVVFRRVWWVVCAIAIGMILVVLVVQFWYNKKSRVYTVTYSLVNTGGSTYPDGTPFVVSDLVSETALRSVISNDTEGEFADIDIEDMIDNDAATIEDTTEDSTLGDSRTVYTLSISAKYFSSTEQAVAFVKALANYPVTRTLSVIESRNYDTYLTSYELADTYSGKISALSSWGSYIDGYYSSLISSYGSEYMVAGRTLGQYQAVASSAFSSLEEQSLSVSLTNGYYVTEAELEILDDRYEALQISIDKNQKVIDAFIEFSNTINTDTSSVGQASASDSEITSLIVSNANMRNEQEDITKTQTKAALYLYDSTSEEYAAFEVFKTSLESCKTALKNATEDLKEVVSAVYDDNTYVAYNGNTVKLDGGLNIILAALIGAVLGFIVIAVVICVKDLPEYKREKYGIPAAAAAGASPVPSDGESSDGTSADGKE